MNIDPAWVINHAERYDKKLYYYIESKENIHQKYSLHSTGACDSIVLTLSKASC